MCLGVCVNELDATPQRGLEKTERAAPAVPRPRASRNPTLTPPPGPSSHTGLCSYEDKAECPHLDSRVGILVISQEQGVITSMYEIKH